MQIDWPAEFGTWLDGVERRADKGDAHAQQVLILVTAALKRLQDLEEPPTRATETATIRWIRQSKRYPLWRVCVFYNSVGARADGVIDQWKREAGKGQP